MNTDQSRRPVPGDDNIAQLKRDIDSGRTGDKVATSDPGLSPLGTDDEAGGNAATAAQVARARQQENAIGAQIHHDAPSSAAKRLWPIVLMAGVIAVFVLLVVVKVLTAP